MLRLLNEDEAAQYADFAYSLALNFATSSYPTYLDGIKTRDDFMQTARRAFNPDRHEAILLFKQNGRAEGWIHYYVLPEDRYLSFCAFNVRSGMDAAAAEFLAFARARYAGYLVHWGFPEENAAAADSLRKLGCKQEESAWVDIMAFSEYSPIPEAAGLERVGTQNFGDFAALHAIHDHDMYWNNARLEKALHEWHIYLLRDEAMQAAAAVYWCVYDQTMMEIFGMDYADDAFAPDAFRSLMVKALNEGKRLGVGHLVYFSGDDEHAVIQSLGFRHVSRYVLYSCTL